MSLPPEVISELLSKPFPELLQWITLGKLTGDALEWAKKRVKELWDKKEYGFTPNPQSWHLICSGLVKVKLIEG